MRAAEKALADSYDDAQEIGCMEHGGFRFLAEAALRAADAVGGVTLVEQRNLLRLSPFNREVVIINRFRLPYAPAYGWRDWLRQRWGWLTLTAIGRRPRHSGPPPSGLGCDDPNSTVGPASP